MMWKWAGIMQNDATKMSDEIRRSLHAQDEYEV